MKKFLLILPLAFVIFPLVAGAASNSAIGMVCSALQIAKIIVAAVGFGIAVILLIVAGIKYMTSGGDDEKASTARKGIINALIGLVVVVAVLFIIGLAQGLVTDVGGTNLITDPCGA